MGTRWTGRVFVVACVALAVGLSPTFRAIVRGTQPAPVQLPPAPRDLPEDPATAARQAPAGATRVLLVGNSAAVAIAPGFRALHSLAVLDEGVIACGFPPELTGVRITVPSGEVTQRPCDPSWESIAVAQFRPDIVFWIVADPIRTGGTYRGRHIVPCDATYDSLYRQRLTSEVATLGATGARVVIPTEAYSRFLGSGERAHDGATDCQNRVRRAVAATTGAQLVELGEWVCPSHQCRKKQNGTTLRPDGLHYMGPGAVIVARWLMDQVRYQFFGK